MLLWPISSCSSGSKREAEIRLDTDVRKCNNILSSVKLTKKGLLGVEKSYHLTYYIMFTLNLKGKGVLVIGSGEDLNGRSLADEIDCVDGRWQFIIRCNAYYGRGEDVGMRTDLIWVRYLRWSARFPLIIRKQARCVSNYEGGFSRRERIIVAETCGVRKASAGLLACWWAIQMGAARVSVIGFGYRNGRWDAVKQYPDGLIDNNPMYDWNKEHEWLEKNVELL